MRTSFVEKARHLAFAGMLALALAFGFTLASMAAPIDNETGSSWGIESAHAASYKLKYKSVNVGEGHCWNNWLLNTSGKQSKAVKWSSSNTRVAKVKKVKNKNNYYDCRIIGVGGGTCTVKAVYKGKTYKCDVTVFGPEYLMAAFGIQALYLEAKYPSSLHISWANYDGTETNSYGEEIQRLTLRGYAMNGMGGYGDLYVIVIRSKTNEHYQDSGEIEGYYYSYSIFDANPSLTYLGNLNNATVQKAYKFYLGSEAKNIPFD